MSDFRKHKVEPAVVADGNHLLRYKEVKKALGCKTNGPIKKLVNEGKLVRVRAGNYKTQLRITKASLEAHLYECNEIEETKKQFGISDADWGARVRQAKIDKQLFGAGEGKAEDNGTVADPSKITYIEGLGSFAMTGDDYMDPLSRRLVPAGCYIDSDESIVCGQIAPCFLERIMQTRMQRRGMNTSEARYHASNISTKVDQFFVQHNEKRLGDYNRRKQ